MQNFYVDYHDKKYLQLLWQCLDAKSVQINCKFFLSTGTEFSILPNLKEPIAAINLLSAIPVGPI